MGRLDFEALADGLRARVDAELAKPAAASIEDLQRHIDQDAHLSPSEMAAYRHRLAQYARSGEPLQPSLDLEPPSCA